MRTLHEADGKRDRILTTVLLTVLFLTALLITLYAPLAMYDLSTLLP